MTKDEPIPSLRVLRSNDRGHRDYGWLKARYSFSFGDYFNPELMAFRSLRVINQDLISPGRGFAEHPHRDMEIFTYMLEGVLEHKDSLGNIGKLHPGDIQVMSAGSGIQHSEVNGSASEFASLMQIWISPKQLDQPPQYTEWRPNEQQKQANKSLIISPDGREQSATIQQDAFIYRLNLAKLENISHQLDDGRGAWLQVIRGELTINGTSLLAGDAAFTELAGPLEISSTTDSEALLFDLK
ncbi:pirin family protein [Persicirhabdus sediminis]|uniref:Pirin family protein n=1 Tax=Persicirhabdus sediminis TaxID=454144 RepID=A0A8J7MFC7_9BACT|nr:pirin family protein [Persicirhabdus sediminis]MBK1791692.1 pirin family protein [Persicirhabdus sediminis]